MEDIISGLIAQLNKAEKIGNPVMIEEIQLRLDEAHELLDTLVSKTDALSRSTIDAANADELLTALAKIRPEQRETALNSHTGMTWLRMLREAADLQGASYADTMTQREAVTAILENF